MHFLDAVILPKKNTVFDGETFFDNGEKSFVAIIFFVSFATLCFSPKTFPFIIHILFLLCHYQKTDETTVCFREKKCFIHKNFFGVTRKKNLQQIAEKRFHICDNKRNKNSYECDIKTIRALRICLNARAKESFM